MRAGLFLLVFITGLVISLNITYLFMCFYHNYERKLCADKTIAFNEFKYDLTNGCLIKPKNSQEFVKFINYRYTGE